MTIHQDDIPLTAITSIPKVMIPTWTTTMFARRSFRSPLPRDRCVSRWWMLNFSRGIFSLLQHGKAGIWMLICCGVYVYHLYTYTYIYIIHTYTYRYVHYLPILLGGLNRQISIMFVFISLNWGPCCGWWKKSGDHQLIW